MHDETRAYVEIQRLQRGYADIATRHAWAEIGSVAAPDAYFSFDTRGDQLFEFRGADAFAAFAGRMTADFSFYEYIPLNFVVALDGEASGRGRSYSLEVAEQAADGEWTEFYGLYDDEYTTVDGAWRFSARRYRTHGRRADGRLQAFPI